MRLRLRARGGRLQEFGASAVEYALIVTMIAVVIIGGVTALGLKTTSLFEKPCDELASVGSPC